MSSSKLYQGSLKSIVLKLLSNHEKMYGYEITQKVKELTKGKLVITEGALYPALHKLEALGFLDVELVKVDNRIRKYYKITEEGLKEKVLIMDEIKEYISIMQNILNPNWSIEL